MTMIIIYYMQTTVENIIEIDIFQGVECRQIASNVGTYVIAECACARSRIWVDGIPVVRGQGEQVAGM